MKKKDLKDMEQKLEELGEFYKDLTYREIIAKLRPDLEEHELTVAEDIYNIGEIELKLRFENSVLLQYLISLKGVLLKRKELLGSEESGNLTIEFLHDFIYDETLNDSKIDLFYKQHSRILHYFFHDYLVVLETPQLALIDDYLNELESFIQTNDSCFIEYFDKIEVGNYFKTVYFDCDRLLHGVFGSIVKNNKLLKESIIKPNGNTSAPLIAQYIRDYKELMLPESELDVLDMDELELLEVKNSSFKEIADIDLYNAQTNLMKTLFRFRFKNRNGFATIMYDLFHIIKPNEFKSKEEIKLEKEDTTTIFDSNYWATRKVREVSKRLDIEVILS